MSSLVLTNRWRHSRDQESALWLRPLPLLNTCTRCVQSDQTCWVRFDLETVFRKLDKPVQTKQTFNQDLLTLASSSDRFFNSRVKQNVSQDGTR